MKKIYTFAILATIAVSTLLSGCYFSVTPYKQISYISNDYQYGGYYQRTATIQFENGEYSSISVNTPLVTPIADVQVGSDVIKVSITLQAQSTELIDNFLENVWKGLDTGILHKKKLQINLDSATIYNGINISSIKIEVPARNRTKIFVNEKIVATR